MPLLSNLIEQAATAFGLMAALIAVCGFVGHAGPVLKGQDEAKIRHATVVGGLGGIGIGLKLVVIGISAKMGL
jgi:hypothetical protein